MRSRREGDRETFARETLVAASSAVLFPERRSVSPKIQFASRRTSAPVHLGQSSCNDHFVETRAHEDTTANVGWANVSHAFLVMSILASSFAVADEDGDDGTILNECARVTFGRFLRKTVTFKDTHGRLNIQTGVFLSSACCRAAASIGTHTLCRALVVTVKNSVNGTVLGRSKIHVTFSLFYR